LELVQRPFPTPCRAFSRTPAGVLPAPAPRPCLPRPDIHGPPPLGAAQPPSGPQVSECNIHTSEDLSSGDLTDFNLDSAGEPHAKGAKPKGIERWIRIQTNVIESQRGMLVARLTPPPAQRGSP
jgi:hypothetical protein